MDTAYTCFIVVYLIFWDWHGFSEIMTTNIPGEVIAVGDHIVAGVLWGFIGAIIGFFGVFCPLFL
jgi:hypothetical protein